MSINVGVSRLLIFSQVMYADSHDVPFLAFSGGHGAIDSLGEVVSGLQIDMRQLNHVRLNPDNMTATIGGGVKAKEVTDALWAVGKRSGQLIHSATRTRRTDHYSDRSLRVRRPCRSRPRRRPRLAPRPIRTALGSARQRKSGPRQRYSYHGIERLAPGSLLGTSRRWTQFRDRDRVDLSST